MKYLIDQFNEDLKVWQGTGYRFQTQKEAIAVLDKLYFGSQNLSKHSFRIIERSPKGQKVIAQRLYGNEEKTLWESKK